jgi:ABC-type uncharacterized transport system permease subunit
MRDIEVRDLRKTFVVPVREAGLRAAVRSLVRRDHHEVRAVDGISFVIEPGEVVGFLGPNGAGKTTTLKMLSGLLYPTGGELSVLGHVPSRRERPFLERITLVMGNRNQLQWDLPAVDSFEMNRAVFGLPRPDFRRTLGELVELLQIGDIVRKPVRQPNMLRLIQDVREGKLDYLLVKPRDSQLLVSIRELSVWQGVDCLVGTVVIGVAVARLETGVGVVRALTFLGAVLLGVLTIYCFWLLLSIGAFWVVRLEFIVELFEGVYQAGRWPVGIYPVGLRVLLTFLVPLAFAVTVPAQAIAGLATGRTLLAAVAFTTALTTLTRWAWRQGLRHYSGASA